MIAMKLDGGQSDFVRYLADHIFPLVHEDSHLFDGSRKMRNESFSGGWSGIARTLLIEDEAQRIGAGVNRAERVFLVRNPADLDPSHTATSRSQSRVDIRNGVDHPKLRARN